VSADTATGVRQLAYFLLTGRQRAEPAHRVQDRAHRRAPLDQVVHVEERVERRADRLYLVVEEAVVVAVPAAVDGLRQHLRRCASSICTSTACLAGLVRTALVKAACVNAPGGMLKTSSTHSHHEMRQAQRVRRTTRRCAHMVQSPLIIVKAR